ncbi:MAG: M17 family metallopeptidase [Gammaproteobacteria bacterium]
MSRLLPEPSRISISRSRSAPTANQLKRFEHVLIIMPERPGTALLHKLPAALRHAVTARLKRSTAGQPLSIHLSGTGQPVVTIGFVKAGTGVFEVQCRARKIAACVLQDNPQSLALVTHGWDEEEKLSLQTTALAAVLSASFRMPASKSNPSRSQRLRRVSVFEPSPELDLERLSAEAEGNNLARWLTGLPPNQLDASGYREMASALADREGWRSRFLDEKALRRKGAGAFLAVSQGNADRDAGIIHLRYRPEKQNARPAVCLVGKGICFDTGGNNLKPFKGMLDMHEDMQGSAVALGTLLALTRIRFPHAVDCWLAVTENRIGAAAYKSRDVVTASNGVSIEVIHTDAEGRMVLADTLALASADKPGIIIDYATLTGACVAALTDRYSGVFSNREHFHEILVQAGRNSGERVWPFPMDSDFEEAIESTTADIAQCSVANEGDHILAARFLQRFVDDDTPWVHIDLAAGHHKGGLGLIPTPVTGFGVRYTLNLLIDQDLGKAAAT